MNSPALLFDLLQANAMLYPQAPAILSPGKGPLSYQMLAGHIMDSALQLNRMGIRRGDRLAVVLPNGPEMATAFLAVSSVCACAPLNPAYSIDEMTFSMQDLHIKALLTLPGRESPSRNAARALAIPVIDLEPDEHVAGLFRFTSDLPDDGHVTEPSFAGLEDVALVLHTSGTTSRPKIVPLTQRNISFSVQNIKSCYDLSTADRCLNMMPLFHIHGLMASLSASLVAGASVICAPGFVPDRAFEWLTALRPTWYTAVPTIHQAIIELARHQPDAAKAVHLRFIRSCSSSLAPQVARDLENLFRVPVVEAYGMTEASHQIASNPLPPRERKFGSVGLPTGTTRVSILDENGKSLPANAMGEICIRGENVMPGYESNPAANASSFTGDWLRTGDRGTLDEDGYLFIQGRLKELINRGGEKISPREIDEALLRHPAVKQAVAFAVPHPTLGEDVAAAVVFKDGKSASMQDLRQFVAAGLADFKVPRLIVFLPEIPKGATGKIQRIGLAEKLKQELEMARSRRSGTPAGPLTPIEEEVFSIWKDVLGTAEFGPHDDFLACGGESIQAGRILARVNERFGLDLQIGDIFTASTVSLMAGLIEEKKVQE